MRIRDTYLGGSADTLGTLLPGIGVDSGRRLGLGETTGLVAEGVPAQYQYYPASNEQAATSPYPYPVSDETAREVLNGNPTQVERYLLTKCILDNAIGVLGMGFILDPLAPDVRVHSLRTAQEIMLVDARRGVAIPDILLDAMMMVVHDGGNADERIKQVRQDAFGRQYCAEEHTINAGHTLIGQQRMDVVALRYQDRAEAMGVSPAERDRMLRRVAILGHFAGNHHPTEGQQKRPLFIPGALWKRFTTGRMVDIADGIVAGRLLPEIGERHYVLDRMSAEGIAEVSGLDAIASIVETELVRRRVNGVPETYALAQERAQRYRHKRPDVLRGYGGVTAREIVKVVWGVQTRILAQEPAQA